MGRLEFTKNHLTGTIEIDNQHRELFARGNAVLFPEAGKPSDKDVAGTLEFLNQYVKEHFPAEERMMEYYGYARLDDHRRQHQRLRKKVEELYNRANKAGTDKGVAIELSTLLNDWFTSHIKEWDQTCAIFVKKRTEVELKSLDLDDVDFTEVEFTEL